MRKGHVHYRNYRTQGFTLVELAIVLVVIGLIAGGTMAGLSVVEGARVRRLVGDYTMYFQAVQGFHQKYGTMPGDLNTATTMFGTPAGNCDPPDGTGVCNGNGKGNLSDTGVYASYERFQSWRHLVDSGFIAGKYTGNPSDLEENTKPRTSFDGIFHMWNEGAAVFGTSPYQFKDILAVQTTGANNNALTPAQAWEVDKKMDDGIPSLGRLFAYSSTALRCHTGPDSFTPGTYEYRLSSSARECRLEFVLH